MTIIIDDISNNKPKNKQPTTESKINNNSKNENDYSLTNSLIGVIKDDYDFIIPSAGGNKGVSSSDAYKIIGNAVPPLLAYNIAMRLQENWEKYFK